MKRRLIKVLTFTLVATIGVSTFLACGTKEKQDIVNSKGDIVTSDKKDIIEDEQVETITNERVKDVMDYFSDVDITFTSLDMGDDIIAYQYKTEEYAQHSINELSIYEDSEAFSCSMDYYYDDTIVPSTQLLPIGDLYTVLTGESLTQEQCDSIDGKLKAAYEQANAEFTDSVELEENCKLNINAKVGHVVVEFKIEN